ncbi:phytoene desaturase family protein [Candidatus Puniceispirillum marinum]|uniref:Phytoene dehydrogenase n=1 Tax=Puniceispirillum marinum (strain IMCC1322) TaxID=488538 RepID=D5BNT7_PUNMI|nr:phytoene desaturase family protein [Candidatus Puniceispirillum marinum]ADE40371.1 phytoene dehydrogenase [Candidatus Puniceispirillum marinum IMCC1322]
MTSQMPVTPLDSDPGAGEHILVIGAGFGGIASALRMRAKGFEVTLVDRLSAIGGRAQVFERGGFRHDAGPTVITAPFLFDELFELFGEKREDHLDFRPLDPWYRFYFHGGRQFDYRPSIEDTNDEIRKFSADDVKGYAALLKTSKAIFDIGFEKLADRPFTKLWTMLAQIPSLLKLKSYHSVAGIVNSHIKHPLLRQAFSIHPLLVGGNPFTTTSIYSLIHYLERRWGVFFCMGGTGRLVAALHDLLIRVGVKVELNVDIAEITMQGDRATGAIAEDGRKFSADRVICNGDPPTIYSQMLPADKHRKKRLFPDRLTHYSMGLYVLFFGTRTQYPDIAHHTIWMGPRYKELLADIFDKKILADDFSLYLHRPTATDASFAPDGCDSFYVLCPVPNLRGNIDWDTKGPELRDRIVTALSATIMPDLETSISDEFWMTPEDFKKDYRSMHGAGFSIAPIFVQSAWFRYHNRDPHIPNLYFAAAGAHPGAGMPGVLCSAKVVETLIDDDVRSQR